MLGATTSTMEKIRKFQESVEPVITAALREAILAQSDTPLALVHAHIGREKR